MKKIKAKVQQKKDNYYKSTPKKWRKIGDSIQDIGIIIGSFTAGFTGNPLIGIIAIVIGRIGKIITNFATE